MSNYGLPEEERRRRQQKAPGFSSLFMVLKESALGTDSSASVVAGACVCLADEVDAHRATLKAGPS